MRIMLQAMSRELEAVTADSSWSWHPTSTSMAADGSVSELRLGADKTPESCGAGGRALHAREMGMENGECRMEKWRLGCATTAKHGPLCLCVRACVRCVCVSTRVAMNRENVEFECGKKMENKKKKGQRIR